MRNVWYPTSKRQLKKTWLLLCTLVLFAPAAAATELKATRAQTFGCFFGSATDGILGATQDSRTLSTEIAGGVRPSFVINVVGNATLSIAPQKKWLIDDKLLLDVSTKLELRTLKHGGDIQPLPFTFNTNGVRNFFVEIQGTRGAGFFEAGNYQVIATFNCI